MMVTKEQLEALLDSRPRCEKAETFRDWIHVDGRGSWDLDYIVDVYGSLITGEDLRVLLVWVLGQEWQRAIHPATISGGYLGIGRELRRKGI